MQTILDHRSFHVADDDSFAGLLIALLALAIVAVFALFLYQNAFLRTVQLRPHEPPVEIPADTPALYW